MPVQHVGRLRPRVTVRKSRGQVFAGMWYVLAFGKCYWRQRWDEALSLALFLAPKHSAWIEKVKASKEKGHRP